MCRHPVFKVSVEGWDGRWHCDCEHAYHYVCAACVTEWGLMVWFDAQRLDTCLDNVRTAKAVAGDDPKSAFPELTLEDWDREHAAELVKWRNQVMQPPPSAKASAVEVLATPEGERVGAPHLVGLTKAKQDKIEKDLMTSLAEQVKRDVDEAFLKQAVADAEVNKAAHGAKVREMGEDL